MMTPKKPMKGIAKMVGKKMMMDDMDADDKMKACKGKGKGVRKGVMGR